MDKFGSLDDNSDLESSAYSDVVLEEDFDDEDVSEDEADYAEEMIYPEFRINLNAINPATKKKNRLKKKLMMGIEGMWNLVGLLIYLQCQYNLTSSNLWILLVLKPICSVTSLHFK
ncbi:hypothetical protein HK096_001606, partial [Nowakowskiella sp. JEL0078]